MTDSIPERDDEREITGAVTFGDGSPIGSGNRVGAPWWRDVVFFALGAFCAWAAFHV